MRMSSLGFDRRDVNLTINLLKMMVRDRYLGSMFGGLWAIFNPLLLLALFTFVFGFVFKSKIPGSETTFAFAIWLIAGYGPWIAITESIINGATSVVGNAQLIKNLSFKAECLPIAAALSSLPSLLVSLIFLMILLVIDGQELSKYLLTVPFVIAIQFVVVIGLALLLSGINVFVRDLALVLPHIMLVLLFTSPIFYPLDLFPENIRGIVAYNPFAIVVDGYRNGILHGQLTEMDRVAFVGVFATLIFLIGLLFFRRLKPHFDSCL